jgi:hypothetical protein
MGFINVNSQQVHTSNINLVGTSSIYGGIGIYTNSTTTPGRILASSGGATLYSHKAKYIILGEEVEVDGYQDSTTAIIISSINIMGKPFYDDLKKQNVHLPVEIEEFLEQRFIILERDKKIEDILKNS